ncbi:MAG: hypothetical protein PHX61_14385 [Alphaproteobacteria bacterium]|nr:hypothetical protein [Alphaproteobacteria bacterium]
MSSKLAIEVVLICDPVPDEDIDITHLSLNGDRPSVHSFNLIYNGLLDAAQAVTHYSTISGFINNIAKHKDSVVLPYWFGELSRNRHALVPAICESNNIAYVGADAYTKVVCNDKHLAKAICSECGIATPVGFILTGLDELALLSSWTYPAVVKPICQGSSLGISENSLVHDAIQANEVALSLADVFGWPVLVEEMVTGREISICMIGDHINAPEMKAVSWAINGQADYLDSRLFTYKLKYLDGCEFTPVDEDIILSSKLRRSCEKLFHILDKVEVMRLDGRMTDNGFVAFELSPDLDLRPDGELAATFGSEGYPELLKRLLVNALKRHG